MHSFDILLLGGGLHSGLAALALAHTRPGLRVAVVEASDRIGGNHLWSFHGAALKQPPWLSPLVEFSWPRHEVSFPNHRRLLDDSYHSITSERLHQAITAPSKARYVFLETRAVDRGEDWVRCEDGSVLHGECVIDGRGAEHLPAQNAGYQKFAGTELLLSSAHDFEHPILMDACVEQLDGFRFFYILPFGPKRLFIEDTYFSENPLLDAKLVDSRVLRHASWLGLQVDGIGRQERGVLPMPWKAKPLRNGPELCIGARGDWYHPATAYSVPFAVQTALAISAANGRDDLRRKLGTLRQHHENQATFARFLNMLLFLGFEPEERVHVFERFYRLPMATIQRFYSLDMTVTDRVRLLFGRPPRGFSLGRVLGAGRT